MYLHLWPEPYVVLSSVHSFYPTRGTVASVSSFPLGRSTVPTLCCKILRLPNDLVQGVASQQVLVPISSSSPWEVSRAYFGLLSPESWLLGGLQGQATSQESTEIVGPTKDAGALIHEALEQPHIGAVLVLQRH